MLCQVKTENISRFQVKTFDDSKHLKGMPDICPTRVTFSQHLQCLETNILRLEHFLSGYLNEELGEKEVALVEDCGQSGRICRYVKH